jgi:hypothetical protein
VTPLKFQSKYRNAAYVLRKSQKLIYPGVGTEIKWGLTARFAGPQRIFDSEIAQVDHDWSDEDRIFVENKLLAHKDFGNGLYLAPGEILPEDRVENVKNKDALIRSASRCQEISTEGTEIVQCKNEAAVGNQFCDEHRRDDAKIIKGMLTTNS